MTEHHWTRNRVVRILLGLWFSIALADARVQAALVDGLAAHYRLDQTPVANGTLLTATVGGSATMATDNGTADKSVAGILGRAISLDGTGDWATSTAGPDLDTSDYTVSLWAKLPTGLTTRGTLVSQGGFGYERGYLMDWSDGSTGRIRMETGLDGTASGSIATGAGALPADDQWHHVVVAIKRGTTGGLSSIYVDGVEKVTGNIPAGDLTNSTLHVGRLNTARSTTISPLTGSVDEVAVWNRALTLPEVRLLYNKGNATTANAPPSAYVLDSHLLAHYKLDESSASDGTTIAAAVGDNGILHTDNGSTNKSARGAIDMGLQLDGTGDYVSADGPDVGTADFTVAAWIKPSEYKNGAIVAKGGYDWVQGWVFDFNTVGNGTLRLETSTGAYLGQGTAQTVPGVVTLGDWQHVAVSVKRDPNAGAGANTTGNGWTQFYVNGELVGSGDIGAGNLTSVLDLNIGRIPNRTTVDFKGLIDDVRIYDYALSAQEIFALATNNFNPVPEPSACLLAALGVALVGFFARRRPA